MAELVGTIIRIFGTPRPTWCAGVIKHDGGAGKTYKFTSPRALIEGDEVVFEGNWSDTPQWGLQFVAERVEILGGSSDGNPFGDKALVSYLANNPDLQHIGEKRATKLVKTFGGIDAFSAALLETPERIVEAIPGLTESRVREIAKAWSTSFFAHKWRVQLIEKLGLREWQARQAVEKLGPHAGELLERNPWALYLALPQLGFDTVDKLAIKQGHDPEHPYRMYSMVFAALMHASREGHTYMPIDAAAAHQIEEVSDLDYIQVFELDDELVCALKPLARAEEILADGFEKLSALNPFWGKRVRTKPPEELNAAQIEAYYTALDRTGMVITGGAGTGKTYVARAIADAYEGARGTVLLAAPTGKAAKRLAESTGRTAQTIHRLLGAKPRPDGTFYFELGVIDCDLLIIDEASMCDSLLLSLVIERIDFAKTALILMGDHNQLPPVQPGNPLRDIMRGEHCPIVRLDEVVRQTGALKRCCIEVLHGNAADDVPGEFEIVRSSGGQALVRELAVVLVNLDKDGYDLVDDVQVLTPMHKGVTGTANLNQLLLSSLCDSCDETEAFPTGAKVIQTQNDYRNDVFNGEVGRVLDSSDEHVSIRFDNRVVAYRFAEKDAGGNKTNPHMHLSLAYALTVHKSQGSEYPVVVTMLDTMHTVMLHRNLLYTAVTRGKERSIVIGTNSAIATALRNVETDKRRTTL